MDAVERMDFVESYSISKHNFNELEGLAVSAMEALSFGEFTWDAFNRCDDVQIPVGLRSMLELALSKSDEVLNAIMLYHSCIVCGSVFNPPYGYFESEGV